MRNYEHVIFNEFDCSLLKLEITQKNVLDKRNFINSLMKVSSNLLSLFNTKNINNSKQNELKENIIMLFDYLNSICKEKKNELDNVIKKHDSFKSHLINEQQLHDYSYEEMQNFVLENLLIEKNNTYKNMSNRAIRSIMDMIKVNELEEIVYDNKDCLFYETIKIDPNRIKKPLVNNDVPYDKKYMYIFDRKADKKYFNEQINFSDKKLIKLKEELKELQNERKQLNEDMGYSFLLNNKKFDCRIKLNVQLIDKDNSSDSSNTDDEYALEDDDLELDESIINNGAYGKDDSASNRFSNGNSVIRKLRISERQTNPLSFDNSHEDSDSCSMDIKQIIDEINTEKNKKKILLSEINKKNFIYKKMKHHLRNLYYKLNFWDCKINKFK